ncbi:MAG: hypothetical protein BA865_10310 [Desulfobacterales bacterium S5133MH4]|nr:MAG: hypothetical protein BA865_10310 [Desulfobacterales bacterium S5133MH4]
MPFTVEGVTYSISASIGVSFYSDHGRDLDELLTRADAAMYTAMYTAKDIAGGSFAIYNENV